MKRFGLLALMSVLVPGLALYFVSCGGGGGGTAGGGGNPPVNYSSPSQAASSSQAVTAALALSSAVGSAADLAGSQIPAGYAPSLKAKAVDTSAIANIDPRLKTVIDKMMTDLKNPMVGAALTKARSLKTVSLASTISVSNPCATGGYYTVSGSDTSTGTYSEHTVNVVYYSCQDSATYPYVVLSGSLSAYDKHTLDGLSDTADVTATALSLATHMSSTVSSTDVLTGTFNKSSAVSGGVTSGTSGINGSIQVTSNLDSTVIDATVGFNNISDVWSSTTTTSSGTVTTEEHTLNGSLTFGISSGGSSFTFALSLSQLDDKVRTNADLSEDEWISGSISMNWSPNPDASACLPGTLTIATLIPIHTPNGGFCPTSGEFTVNNADIKFGVPSGTQVTVTVGGSSLELTDCPHWAGVHVSRSGRQVSQPASL